MTILDRMQEEWRRWHAALAQEAKAKRKDQPAVAVFWNGVAKTHAKNVFHLVDIVMRENHR